MLELDNYRKEWGKCLDITGSVDEPLLTRGAITFLDGFLTKEMNIIEVGMGTSTAWFAKRVKSMVSIETVIFWVNNVNNHLKDENLKNVSTIFSEEFKKELVESFKDEYFDFILVDGDHWQRNDYLISLEPKVKKQGILMMDDTYHSHYQSAISQINSLNYKSETSKIAHKETTWWVKK